VVDVVVAQVRRDKTRNLGIVPPQTASVALQGTGVTTTGTGTNGTTTTSTNPINFNSLQHLNSTNYAVTIAPVTAQALLNDSDTRILQNPQIRASNGEKAKLTIADKIPIATGSFGTPVGVGTAVGAVGVNTQFTYTDVGVIMEITPTIHPDGQVTLKTSLEISNVSSQSTIGGITQPIISQRKIEHTIRLDDGEINLLGGILEQDYTKTTTGWPFLGQVPVLKYIFAQESKEVTTNEIIFLLIPHIVRAQVLTALNRRALDVGTGTGIDLRIAAVPAPNGGTQLAVVAPAAPSKADPSIAPAGTMVNPAAPAIQPSTPAAASPPATGGAANPAGNQLSLRLDPGNIAQAQGSTFALNVVLAHGQDISSVPIQISYDPKVLEFVGVANGDYLAKDGQPVALVHRNDAATGRLTVSAQRPPGSAGVSGDGTVFNLTFVAKAKGAGVVSISVGGARNSQNQSLQVAGSQAAVTVN
jgi:general secretion pathway protein D